MQVKFINNYNKARVINYVMDNCGYPHNPVADWCGFFLYHWWFYTHTFGNCACRDYSAVPSRQKNIKLKRF